MNVRKFLNILIVIAMLATSLVVYQPVAAKSPARFNLEGTEYVPNEVVVVFADSDGKNLVSKIEQAVQTAQESNGEVTRLSLDGTAVIQVEGDLASALTDLNQQPDVLFAEPNYIYSLPVEAASSDEGFKLNSEYVLRHVTPSAKTNGASLLATPKTSIQSMVAQGIYPTDAYLNENQGWSWIGADIVWPNTTTSPGVCVIDTGADTLHPDIKARMLTGYDFVNADTVPADDNGHGTHVTGIIAAVHNNAIGVAGVSTGKVVPVKALDAQGLGTNFDVAMAIAYCANRADIRVINLSLGSTTSSNLVYDALLYATTPTGQTVPAMGGSIGGNGQYAGLGGKGKLAVVAAGNAGDNVFVYPAAYAEESEFVDRIISVGASGRIDTTVGGVDYVNYECRAEFSNYGSWVVVVAPGRDIYSTTPYDKPFYQNYYSGANTRYDYMAGTSMAAGFVSAAAARRMGYKPAETSTQVGTMVRTTGNTLDTTGGCWDATMTGKVQTNVAKLMERAAVRASVFDAVAGTPLFKAKVLAYGGGVSKGSSVIPAVSLTVLPGEDPDPKRIFMYFQPTADILNLPTNVTYTVKVNLANYTVGDQSAFQHEALATLTSGEFTLFNDGAVPPKTANFDIVTGWQVWQQPSYEEANGPYDLDLYVWLPTPGVGSGQPAQFVVGYSGDAFGFNEADSYGTLNAFPFSRLRREGGYLDGGPTIESSAIHKRPSVAALPYYAGNYNILVTDYGQTIDHDNDGCGDNYGAGYSSSYSATADPDCPPTDGSGTLGIPLLGAYYTPYVYVWKDGVVKFFQNSANNFGPWVAGGTCNEHWWKAFSMSSPAAVPVFTAYNNGTPGVPLCDGGATPGFIPYTGYVGNPGDRIVLLNK